MNRKIITTLFSLLHFVVDGLCSLIIFSRLYNDDYNTCLMIFLIYNFLAFLSQPFVGLLIDFKNHPRFFLIISVVFLLLGCLFSKQLVLSSLCLGIGNSFFHICGGKYVIEKNHHDIVSLGIFVSPGAIGLIVGQHYYSKTLFILFMCLLFLISALILILKDEDERKNKLPIENIKMENKQKIILLLILMFIVCVRSFVGKILVFDFTKTKITFLLIACATALGKVLGGIFVKWINVKKTILISMIGSMICFLFPSNLLLSLLGILTFNFTMPITLWYACRLLNGKEGFAFGLLAASLIPGYLIGMFPYSRNVVFFFILLSCLFSLIFIFYIERKFSYAHHH